MIKKRVNIFVVSLLLISACSTRKDAAINRGYHGMTTKYNVLYNGKVAFDKGVQELADQYEDNYWDILPIEPLHIDEEKFELPGKSKEEANKSSFDIAEEKAVKAVQKHGMDINGRERNKQIDDAYLLLGKSRYYSQRFVPALEAFEFVEKHYPKGDLSKELQIWKAKTQIRLQNEEQAIASLKNILLSKKLDEKIKEEAQTALALAYMNLDSIPQTILHLNKAVETHENTEQYSRNLFVLGQLYRKQDNIDSSQIAFTRILDYKKSPYKYKIHSYIEQAKNATDSTDTAELQKKINTLIKHYENNEYRGELYFQTAALYFKDKKDSVAVNNLMESIRTPLVKDYQKGISYERLGNYYFDEANFVKAGAYYDSVMPTVVNENTKRIRKLKRKRKSLEEVIYHETILKNNDSIFSLLAMNETERNAFFGKHIAKIKRADEIAAIKKENSERAQNAGANISRDPKNSIGGGKMRGGSGPNEGKWYFYNMQSIGYGKAEFQKKWGNRKLEDNWRLSENSRKNENNELVTESTNELQIDASKKYDIAYYLDKIPKDEKVIQTMRDDNSKALYQLGLVYKEKFLEYPLAIQRLERFLSEKPKEKLILPAKYHLYKIYKETGDPKMLQLKKEIIAEYPESRYSTIIQNPEKVIAGDNKNTPEGHYEKVYCDFEYGKYQRVIEQCDIALKQYQDEPIQPKFDLLRAFANFNIQGKKPFMNNLEYIVGNYPKTEEARRAQEILDFLNGVKKEVPKEEKETEGKRKENKVKRKNKKVKSMTPKEKRKEVMKMMKKKEAPSRLKMK